MDSDEQLVIRIRRGEEGAFEELYRRYHQRLFSYLLRLTGDRTAAEDLFQDVFMTVLRTDAYTPQDLRFAGWLFKVARNKGLSYLRDRGRMSRKETLATQAVQPESHSPEEWVDRHRRLEAVSGALKELSEPQQEVLLLKTVGGLTYQQIAHIQGVPEGTVKSRLHLAVRAVRSFFRPPEG